MNNWKRLNLGELGKSYSGLNGKTKNDFGKGSPYIPYLRIFEDGKIDLSRMDYVSIDKHERQNSVQVGDLFFTTSSETINEVGMTSVLIDEPTEKTYLNSFCFGFRLSNFDDLTPEYARYLFRSLKVRKDISLLGQGSTRYNLPKTILFKKLFVDVPDIPYQQKIAKILNTIDAVIEKTEHAITKYQAIKKGMMHDLFTRGIDVKTGQLRPSFEDAPELYKESVLEMIPKDWELKPLSKLTNLITDGAHFSPIPQENGLPIGNVKDMTTYGFNYSKCTLILKETFELLERQNCSPKKGDVLLSKDGTIGRVILFNDNHPIVLLSSIAIIRTNDLISGEYLSLVLQSFYFDKELFKLVSGSALKRITLKDIQKINIPYPKNIQEQCVIFNKLEGVNNLIQKEQTNLTKHQNIKKGLMQDLLTGKVEVKV